MVWRILLLGVMGCLITRMGWCKDVWLIEQEFVKWGKKESYEAYKKEQQKNFVKKIGFPRYAVEDPEDSAYFYLIPVKDFKGLNSLMKARIACHEMLIDGDKKEVLSFLSLINFFIETVHFYIDHCSFVPQGKESLLSYPGVYYAIYGIVPGNGPLFERRLEQIAGAQKNSETPICFRTWRLLFGGDVPTYMVAVFANSAKEAKDQAKQLRFIDAQMKNVLRQEKKGVGLMRKDLSAIH